MTEHKKFIEQLKAMGYQVKSARNGHLKVCRPNGSYLMTMSASPGDRFSATMARQLFRRLLREEGR